MRIYTKIKFKWCVDTQSYVEEYAEYEDYDGDVALCKGSSSSSGDQTTTVRYAPYVESYHTNFLATVSSNRNAIINSSPFAGYTNIPVDEAFFGTGYIISSFPSLYDLYGKFMAGLDIEALWDQVLDATVNSVVVKDLISAQSAMMDEDITINSLPRLKTGHRDINSVMSSSFVIGKSIIEDAKTKALALFSADLKYKLISIADNRWRAHLDWNKNVVGMYSEIMKFYFSTKTDIDEVNYSMAAKNKLWPFTVLDFERAALGALQGATNTKTDVAGASTTSKVLGGALSGAAMGAMIGSNFNTAATSTTAASTAGSAWGAGAGAVLGIAAALTY